MSARSLCTVALLSLLMMACASGHNRGHDTGPTSTTDGGGHDSSAAGDSGHDAAIPGTDAAMIPGTDAGTIRMMDAAMPTSDAGRDAAVLLVDGGRDAAVLLVDGGHDAAAPIDGGHDAAVVGPCGGGDCTSCGGAMRCAGGACGANPMSLGYDFESGVFPAGWTNGAGGTTAWRMATSGAHGGTHAIESGAITDSGTSGVSFTISLASAATISFWLSTSSESGFDYLHFYVDGTQLGTWSGTTAWTQASYGLASGTHTIEWRYAKDPSVSVGSDAVWVDDVTIVSGGGGSATGFESATLPAGYTTSGSATWSTTTTMPHAGTRCAQSGLITDSQSTSMSTTVALPAASTLTFWYRVSSESSFDYLGVYLDTTLLQQWSGTVAWTMASFPIAAGTHTVEWRYSKDGSVSAGSDAAWVDDIDFGFTPVIGPLCM